VKGKTVIAAISPLSLSLSFCVVHREKKRRHKRLMAARMCSMMMALVVVIRLNKCVDACLLVTTKEG